MTGWIDEAVLAQVFASTQAFCPGQEGAAYDKARGLFFLFDGAGGRVFNDCVVCSVNDRVVTRRLSESGEPMAPSLFTEFSGRGWRTKQAAFVVSLLEAARRTLKRKGEG